MFDDIIADVGKQNIIIPAKHEDFYGFVELYEKITGLAKIEFDSIRCADVSSSNRLSQMPVYYIIFDGTDVDLDSIVTKNTKIIEDYWYLIECGDGGHPCDLWEDGSMVSRKIYVTRISEVDEQGRKQIISLI